MKTKILRVGKSTLSIILTIMMIVSTMAVGMFTVNSATQVTVYFTPDDSWLNNNYTYKCNYMWKYNSENDLAWSSADATDTGKTISSKKVYSATFSLEYDGARTMQFQAYDGTTWKAQVEPFANSWTAASVYNGKYWNGSSWVDPTFDSTSTDWYVVGGDFGNDWSTSYKNYKMTANSDGTYSYDLSENNVTLNKNSYFKFHNTSDFYASNKGNNENQEITEQNVTNKEQFSFQVNNNSSSYYYTGSSSSDLILYIKPAENKMWIEKKTVTNYYIGGRLQQNWNVSGTGDKVFTKDSSSGNYYYETGKTVAELSVDWSDNNYTAKQYFFIHTGSGTSGTWYGADNHTFQNNLENNKQSLTEYNDTNTDGARLLRFADESNTSGPVTLWFNASNKELWYTAESSTPTPTQLTKPTISVTYNSGKTSATVKVTNTSDYSNKGTITYKLYKESTEVDSNITGEFTISESGDYKVKVSSSDTTNYTDSEYSNVETITLTAPPTTVKEEVGVKSTKTMLYTYFGSNDSWAGQKYVHMWNDGGADITSNYPAMTNKNQDDDNTYYDTIYYYEPDETKVSSGSSIGVALLKQSSWVDSGAWNFGVIDAFKKGTQYVIYRTSTSAEVTKEVFDPIAIDSIEYPSDVQAGKAMQITVNVSGGLPEFIYKTLGNTSGDKKYNLTVSDVNGDPIDIGDSATFSYDPNGTKVTFTYTPQAGNSTINLKVSDDGSIDSVGYTKTFEVATDTAMPQFTNNDTYVYVKTGSTVNFSTYVNATIQDGSAVSYNTTSSDSKLVVTGGTTATPTIKASADGTYSVTVKATNATDSSKTIMKTISVIANATGTEPTKPDWTPYLYKYNLQDGNGSVPKSNAILSGEMTYVNDGTYEYFYYEIADGGKYLYNIYVDDTVYNKGVTNKYQNSIYIQSSYSGWSNVFETGYGYSKYYIIYTVDNDSNNDNNISVVSELPDPNAKDTITVYAKDTSLRGGNQSFTISADTKITSEEGIKGSTSHTNYYEYKIEKGTTITVQTTINSGTANASKYYVKGFVINGKTYGLQDGPATNNIYTATYRIPEDTTDKFIEITPVYFLKDESNCVTFYAEGFDETVQEKWGNTIACYAWDNGDDSAGNSGGSPLGGYPGQPMLYEGGRYFMQVLKDCDGVTMNNYIWDDIHSKNFSSQVEDNCQTYDYNDFATIASKVATSRNTVADNIIFRFKYKTSMNNKDTSAKPTNKDTYTNGWENLVDYYNDDIDIFGNVLTDVKADASRLRIVSRGYQIIDGLGRYYTTWDIYSADGNTLLISDVNPADLIADGASTNTALATETNLKKCIGVPAEITFEKAIKNANTWGNGQTEVGRRNDGRWYYSTNAARITSNIVIEYETVDSATSAKVWVTDPFDTANPTTGTNTKTKAFFTTNNSTTAEGEVDSSQYWQFAAQEDADGKYQFYGWYLLQDGIYTLVSTSFASQAPMTSSDTFVARFVEVEEGSLRVYHNLYSNAPKFGTDDVQPSGGFGDCTVKVEVIDPQGNVLQTYISDGDRVEIPQSSHYINSNSDNSLRITLNTVTKGANQFLNFYMRDKEPTETKVFTNITNGATISSDKHTASVVRTVTIAELFEGTTLKYPVINYYSDIMPVTSNYKITYHYNDRFGKDQVYVVKGTLEQGVTTLTEDIILANVPYENAVHSTISWNLKPYASNNTNGYVIGAGNDTHVYSVKSDPYVNITFTDENQDGAGFTYTVKYGTLFTYENIKENTEGYKAGDSNYVVDKETRRKDSSIKGYWVYKDAKTGAVVGKTYSIAFNHICYGDYIIEFVEDEDASVKNEGTSATLQFLDYVRNNYTDVDGYNQSDRVYADFALDFTYNGLQLNTLNDDNVKCGIVFESVGTGTSSADFTDNTTESDLASLKEKILGGSGKYTFTDSSGFTREVFNTEIAKTSLSPKNRIEHYMGYKNTETSQQRIMKAYAYVIAPDANGELTVTLSEAYTFVNFYNIGNMTFNPSAN